MTLPQLKADCSQCQGLCCMALAFDKGDMFGDDKPAGAACRHLQSGYGCAIHQTRAEQGFHGCIGYECLGAGQQVCQSVLPGQSWRDSPALNRRFQHAFRAMREIHRLLELLLVTRQLPLDPGQTTARDELIAALTPHPGWTEASLADFESGPLRVRVATFLSTLQGPAATLKPGTP